MNNKAADFSGLVVYLGSNLRVISSITSSRICALRRSSLGTFAKGTSSADAGPLFDTEVVPVNNLLQVGVAQHALGHEVGNGSNAARDLSIE